MILPCQELILAIPWFVTFFISHEVAARIPVDVYNCLLNLKPTSCFSCAVNEIELV